MNPRIAVITTTILNRLQVPNDFIPSNTNSRRNVWFLWSLRLGATVMLIIDNDNFVKNQEVRSRNKADNLKLDSTLRVQFQIAYRTDWSDFLRIQVITWTNVLNAGLWLQDPDSVS